MRSWLLIANAVMLGVYLWRLRAHDRFVVRLLERQWALEARMDDIEASIAHAAWFRRVADDLAVALETLASDVAGVPASRGKMQAPQERPEVRRRPDTPSDVSPGAPSVLPHGPVPRSGFLHDPSPAARPSPPPIRGQFAVPPSGGSVGHPPSGPVR